MRRECKNHAHFTLRAALRLRLGTFKKGWDTDLELRSDKKVIEDNYRIDTVDLK